MFFLSDKRIRKGKMVAFCCDVYSSDRDNTDNSMFFHEGNLKENTGLGWEALMSFFFLRKIAGVAKK